MKKIVSAFILVVSLSTGALAQYNLGDVVADFRLKNIDASTVTLSEVATRGAIVVFTCNHCPFSRAYEDRVIELHKKFATQGYPVLAINSNDPKAYEEDSFENMKARAKEKKFPFAYLEDHAQNIARAFGAVRTPTVFVLKKEGTKYTLQYIGAVDNNSQDPASVSKRYVEDAVNNLLADKPVVINSTKSIGCAIKWKES
jgi:peroxiredoxin